MKKRGIGILGGTFIFLGILLVIILGLVYVLFFGGKNYDEVYEERIESGEIVNPAEDLTVEEAVLLFDERFVYYLLVSIKAYNLHSPVLGEDTPKIEIFVDNETYNAEVNEGEISVSFGEVEGEDIVIYTSKEEAAKMVKDSSYVSESFQSGGSSLERIAGDVTLASKGYLDLYADLTGESITGAFILA